MKTALCLLVFAASVPATPFLVTPVAATPADGAGLYLREVVEEGAEGAFEMTDDDGEKVFVSPNAVIVPEDVEAASVVEDDRVLISFVFGSSGREKLAKATRALIGKKLAVIIDGRFVSAPVVQDPFSSSVVISGDFTREWAESVVERIEARGDPR